MEIFTFIARKKFIFNRLFVLIACYIAWLKPQKPGVITGVFGLLYAIMRILGEQFRMPDAHIGFQALGMTRGQWLSVGMIFVALAVIYICSKSKNKYKTVQNIKEELISKNFTTKVNSN